MVEKYYTQVIAIALGLGLMHSLRAVGLVIGPLVIGKWINVKTLPYLFIYQALSILVWALVIENFYLSLVASIFVGFATTTLWSYTYTLLQQHTDKAYYGRIVAYNDMVFLLTVAVISIVVGLMVEAGLSLAIITAMLGSVFFVAAVYFVWMREHFGISDMVEEDVKISPELEL